MRPLLFLCITAVTLMLCLTVILATKQLHQLRTTPNTEVSPPLTFNNVGVVETHNADERWFVYNRTHFFPIDGKTEIKTKVYYDEKTTFVRQVPRQLGGVVYALEHQPTDRLTALMAQSEVLVFYTTDADNRLRAFYIINGNPLFASY